jgi:hypothetical protein
MAKSLQKYLLFFIFIVQENDKKKANVHEQLEGRQQNLMHPT